MQAVTAEVNPLAYPRSSSIIYTDVILSIVKARRQEHLHTVQLIVPPDYGKLRPIRDSRTELVEHYC